MVITFAHQKGGVGKTTLAVNVAFHLLNDGLTVCVIDSDKQGTLSDIINELGVPLKLETITDYSQLNKLAYDVVIVDTPPYNQNEYLQIFGNSEVVVIPTNPNFADLLAIRSTVALINEAKKNNPNLKACTVINRALSVTNEYQETIKEKIKSFGIEVLNITIANRVAYGRSLASDKGIFSESNKKAHNEIKQLTDEIFNLI